MPRFFPRYALGLAFALLLGAGAMAETGLASFYGTESGSRTANGERFTGRDMTCAHRSARFNTRLRVTDRATGKSIVCRVNDRGPFKRGRIIDLSKAAAAQLGMVKRGVVKVRVERVR